MQHFMNLNLRTKLIILFILIALIPLMLLGLFSYQKSSKMMQEQVSEGMLEKLSQINRNLSFFIQDVEQLSMYIYRNEMVQDILNQPADRQHTEKYEDYKKVMNLFNTVLGSKKWDIRIYIIGLNGDRYFTGEYLPHNYDQYMPNWGIFRKANAANGNLVWDTHYSIRKTDPHEIVLSAGRLLKHFETKETLGYLVIDIFETAVADIYRTDRGRNDNQLFLLDAQGYVISSFPNKATIGTRLHYPFMHHILSSSGGFFETDWEDSPHVVVFDSAEDTHFIIASFVPLQQINEKNGLIRQVTVAIGVIGLLGSVWLAYFLSKTVTLPLYRLITLMKRVESGQLDVTFKSKYKDDIGLLGESFNQMIRHLNHLIQDGYEKQMLLKESEIKTLQAQINPHFLYNTLETVNWMAKIKGEDKISSVIVALGEMMRFSVKKGEEFITLAEDFKHLDHYLTIQQIRYMDKFMVSVRISEEAKMCLIPPLLLQPLVENAITHGLEMKMEPGNLRIEADCDEKHLRIIVEDDGVGMEPPLLEKIRNGDFDSMEFHNTGIGLQNVQKRIQIHFGEMYELRVDSELNHGTRVTLWLPKIESQHNEQGEETNYA